MPSPTQIPAHLLEADKFLSFVRWLCRSCPDARARVALARMWSRLTYRQLTHFEYKCVENDTPELLQ